MEQCRSETTTKRRPRRVELQEGVRDVAPPLDSRNSNNSNNNTVGILRGAVPPWAAWFPRF